MRVLHAVNERNLPPAGLGIAPGASLPVFSSRPYVYIVRDNRV
jgi:hypothetical protein